MRIPLSQTYRYSKMVTAYIEQASDLQSAYTDFPSKAAFAEQIARKQAFPAAHRQVLKKVLQAQYQNIDAPAAVQHNIDALDQPNTFVVCTGQQVHPFIGPMYVLFKVVRMLKLCTYLQAHFPTHTFVPLFWLHTEDHDTDEISYFHWQGTRHTLSLPRRYTAGSLSTTLLQDSCAQLPSIPLRACYTQYATWAEASCAALNQCFGAQGLVALDPAAAPLKQLAVSLFTALADDPAPYHHAMEQRTSQLQQAGYTPLLTSRNLRLFYLHKEKDGITRHALLSSGALSAEYHTPWRRFTHQEWLEEIAQNPTACSPAVGVRPLYQELILPNLAYISGPSELSYWLQLKAVFAVASLPMPLLVPRLHGMWLSPAQHQWMERHKIDLANVFAQTPEEQARHTLQIKAADFSQIQEQSAELFASLAAQTAPYHLQPHVARHHAQFQRTLHKIQQKITQQQLRRHGEWVGKFRALYEVILPKGGLQERHAWSVECLHPRPYWDRLLEVGALDFGFHSWSTP